MIFIAPISRIESEALAYRMRTEYVGKVCSYRDEGVGVANNAFDVSSGSAYDGADGVVRDGDAAGLSHTGVRLSG